MTSFAAAFADADHVLVTDIFAAREQPDGVTSAKGLVQVMRHPDARVASTLDEALRALADEVGPGAVVVTLSAGDANRVGKDLLALRRASEEGVRRNG
jgi:UDP-N-acetylmuramate--alanine ligase